MQFSIENPSSLVFAAPTTVCITILCFYIRRYGVPSFNAAVAGVLVMFGVILATMVTGAFGLKLFYAEYDSVTIVRDEYLAIGGALGFAAMVTGVFVNALPKGTKPKE